jgi:hypothetical protein
MDLASIKVQTLTYVYDLNNEAKEHGFRDDEKWELTLATETDKAQIQKDYYPSVTSNASSDTLLQVFQSVKLAMHIPLSKEEQQMDSQSIVNSNLKYIIAFNPKRARS